MSLFATKPIARIIAEAESGDVTLKRALGPWSLISLGIGAIIGAGIFSITGHAAADYAGPAVVLSFIVAGIGCAFAGMCYSELASMIPVAGSAYTYSYAILGELPAWIIGWDLVLEYAVAAAVVASAWSHYVNAFLHDYLDLTLPVAWTACAMDKLPDGSSAHGVMNLLAMVVIIAISLLLMTGIQQSARVNTAMVMVKLAIVVIFIGLGFGYIDWNNYHPFIPPNTGQFGHFGWSGVMRAAGVVFFAYIGFDCVSTAAQEAHLPQRDMFKGIIGSLAICTVIYIVFSFVLTGMLNYQQLGVGAPVVAAFKKTPYHWAGFLINIGIICGLTSVILVLLLGQSRVFYAMARDGLVPPAFSELHSKWRTPWKSNLIFMVMVSLITGNFSLSTLGDMVSIGTLLAFIIVCAGVIVLRRTQPDVHRPYRAPAVPVFPILGILVCAAMMAALDWLTWVRLVVWLVIGLGIYFGYSRSHSKLQHPRG
jgi:basic amino acid/polyamine antiporter, APA family